jgi:uncharacterized protein (TIGR03435 family)
MFVNFLSAQTGLPVINKTGFTGRYAIELKWTPDSADAPAAADATDASLSTAIREQLGLRLEKTNGPVDVFVIDQVERPSAN